MEILSDRFIMSVDDRFIMRKIKSTAWLSLLDFFIQCNFSASGFPYLLQLMTLNFLLQ